MPNSKAALRDFIANATSDFIASGHSVTICKPAIAVGSELTINNRALIRRDHSASLG